MFKLRSRSKYQGHSFQNMAVAGTFMFQKHILFSRICKSESYTTSDWVNCMFSSQAISPFLTMFSTAIYL